MVSCFSWEVMDGVPVSIELSLAFVDSLRLFILPYEIRIPSRPLSRSRNHLSFLPPVAYVGRRTTTTRLLSFLDQEGLATYGPCLRYNIHTQWWMSATEVGTVFV